jgi:formylglycine-generating enzyme
MLRGRLVVLVGLAGVLMLAVVTAQAVSIVTVPVGNPGNAPDTMVMTTDGTTGYGAVAYNYSIGKYDVTNAQYCEFLNVKASSSDPYGLWNIYMNSYANAGIIRSGSGPYTYSTKPGYDNHPVVGETWYGAIRFANWLTNGQGNGDTESGTYAITGSLPLGNWAVVTPTAAQRAAWAAASQRHWLLPSEDEWYKAAYYDPTVNGSSGGYWAYPTRSNTRPTWELSTSTGPNAGSNSANFYDGAYGYSVTGSTSWSASQDYLTDVGAYPDSVSAFGTLDQGGDVWQWEESTYSGSYLALRGGSWGSGGTTNLLSSTRSSSLPTNIANSIGFRVVMVGVPEPSTIALLLGGGVGLSAYAWRRRRAT